MKQLPWKPATKTTMSRRDLFKASAATLVAATGIKLTNTIAGTTNPLGFCPVRGRPGDVISFFGPNLGMIADDVLVKVTQGSSLAFFRSLGYVDGELLAQIRAITPGMPQGNAQVAMGVGVQSQPTNMPSGLVLRRNIFSWLGNNGSRWTSFQPFSFSANYVQDCRRFWGGLDLGLLKTEMAVPFNENCCPVVPAGTFMTLRACGATAANDFEFAYDATIAIENDMSTVTAASALCSLLISAFDSEFGVTLNCSYMNLADNRVQITIASPNGDPFLTGGIQVSLLSETTFGSQDFSIYDGSMSFTNTSFSFSCDDDDLNSGNCQSLTFTPVCPSTSIIYTPFTFA